MAFISMSVKRLPWGEFKVPVIINKRYSEEASYYTDDREDAVATMHDMARRYRADGNEVATRG